MLTGLMGIAAAMSVLASAAGACMCEPPAETDRARQDAEAVFAGRVVAIRPYTRWAGAKPVGWTPEQGDSKIITIDVTRVWKGNGARTVSVSTDWAPEMCGYPFKAGQEYLIYASKSPASEPVLPKLKVSLCSRTKPVADAAEDLAVLGPSAEAAAPAPAPAAASVIPAASPPAGH